MRTLAIVNQKGGCGKTTTCINLAAVYARRGYRTLIVDMDPQSHCAAGLGVPEDRIEYSIADALLNVESAADTDPDWIWEVSGDLHLAPSTMRLAGLEAPQGGLHEQPDKDQRLSRVLALLASRYDRCLIDCPPTLGLLTFNALRAAREVVVPIQTEFFALRGAEKQWTTIERLIERLGRPIICHMLPTLHNPEAKIAIDVLAALRRKFAGQLLPIVVHDDDALREAAAQGQSVLEHATDSTAAADYTALADWLEAHAPAPTVEIGAAHAHALRSGPSVGAATAASLHAARAGAGGARAAELARRVREISLRPPSDESDPATTSPAAETAPAAEPPTDDGGGDDLRTEAELLSMRLWSLQRGLRGESTPAADAAPAPTLSPGGIAVRSTPRVTTFGARPTSAGVLFVQPGDVGQRVAIAGEFNNWSEVATPLRFNDLLNVHETVAALPPGRHQYRLIVDGVWRTDEHNPIQAPNAFGEINSVVVVPPTDEDESDP